MLQNTMNNTHYDQLENRKYDDLSSFESSNFSANSTKSSEEEYMLQEIDQKNFKEQDSKSLAPKVLAKPKLQQFKDNIWYEDKTWTRLFIIFSITSSILILSLESVLASFAIRGFAKYKGLTRSGHYPAGDGDFGSGCALREGQFSSVALPFHVDTHGILLGFGTYGCCSRSPYRD
ncbi:unnamed protein product [Ambrosiozyma monospora]|uniref:Unnamed protein product n=1 Tax=Ambrosiozyma monospora TaxID=43982 RepID=A0ACB5TXU8_AMBMO|nr:unnamed protein product [Ambrosiozyma monospora]